MNIPAVKLSNGVEIPALGFGTYKVTENIEPIVASALEVGYRHIDTAQMYGNEAEVGKAWRASGIAREELFITSKLNNPNHEPDAARASFEQTLRDLQTDYVDLFLIHWPMPNSYGADYAATWRVLEEFYKQGRARAIGLSNFYIEHLEKLIPDCDIIPHANQIESQPYLQNRALHDLNRELGIVTEAWSPLARGRAVNDATLGGIGHQYSKSASQVALRWGLQRGDVLFPKASDRARQKQNLAVFDFELSPSDMAIIASLEEGEEGRSGSHPSNVG